MILIARKIINRDTIYLTGGKKYKLISYTSQGKQGLENNYLTDGEIINIPKKPFFYIDVIDDRNIKASYKLCLDLNKAVLKANKFLSFFNNKGSKKIEFKEFDIFKNNLDSKFDMIIMVNWIHNIEANLLNKRFQKFISSNLNRGGIWCLMF